MQEQMLVWKSVSIWNMFSHSSDNWGSLLFSIVIYDSAGTDHYSICIISWGGGLTLKT